MAYLITFQTNTEKSAATAGKADAAFSLRRKYSPQIVIVGFLMAWHAVFFRMFIIKRYGRDGKYAQSSGVVTWRIP